MTAGAQSLSFKYGELEATLAVLSGVDASAIRIRFRPLRLHDFPDAVQGGAGSRLRYDLSRTLAYSAFFYLADGRLPQLAAMDLVRATWPEWCRAFVAAAVEADMIQRPAAMPEGASPVLRIMPAGFSGGTDPLTVAVDDQDAPPGPAVACRIELDCRPVLAAIRSAIADVSPLVSSTQTLERSFGWTPPDVPFRGHVETMPPSRGFLDDGPYFERALMLLGACDREELSPNALWRLGRLAAYLDRPAPIDAWKREVGDDPGRPRLHHLLAFRAREKGVATGAIHPETLMACADVDVTAVARRMILETQARRGSSSS